MRACCVCGEYSNSPAVFWFGAVCEGCAAAAIKLAPDDCGARILLAGQPGKVSATWRKKQKGQRKKATQPNKNFDTGRVNRRAVKLDLASGLRVRDVAVKYSCTAQYIYMLRREVAA